MWANCAIQSRGGTDGTTKAVAVIMAETQVRNGHMPMQQVKTDWNVPPAVLPIPGVHTSRRPPEVPRNPVAVPVAEVPQSIARHLGKRGGGVSERGVKLAIRFVTCTGQALFDPTPITTETQPLHG